MTSANIRTAIDTCRTIREMGCTARYRDGEYRINLPGASSDLAYFTTDAEDAIDTARTMSFSTPMDCRTALLIALSHMPDGPAKSVVHMILNQKGCDEAETFDGVGYLTKQMDIIIFG